jgi:hypothetical protein
MAALTADVAELQALQSNNISDLSSDLSVRAILNNETPLPAQSVGDSPTLDTAFHITNALPEHFLDELEALRSRCPLDYSRPTVPRRFFQVTSIYPDHAH